MVPQRLIQPWPRRRGLDPVDGGPVVAPLHLRAGAGRQEAQGAAVPHTLHPGRLHHVRAQLQLRLQVTQTEVPNTLLCLDIFEEFHPMSMGRVGARTGFMQSSWSTRTCCRREGGTPVRSSLVTGVCREEYLVCELACLISSVGGYLGLFLGVSILDALFLGEWVIRQLQRVARK